ncbi:MAG: macro domain-containing protein [Clostridia bacterium]|nr:macro domain-containing protein [Clostridia bacterium]
MPLQIVHNDITKMNTEAIVNAANSKLLMGDGVCGAIFKAAGEEKMRHACEKKSPCYVGCAVITKGFGLPAKYVIHTVGPVWQDGRHQEAEYLHMAYISALEQAKKKRLKSIAIPVISAGSYGYPKEKALHIAVSAIKQFLMKNEMQIFLVVYDKKTVRLSEKLFDNISHYIDLNYEKSGNADFQKYRRRESAEFIQLYPKASSEPRIEDASPLMNEGSIKKERKLEELLRHMDETFSDMLFRMIDEKGRSDVEVYKRANIDRKLFSKIRSTPDYHPKKTTVLALSISLELSLDETIDILKTAGYALSMSSKFDVIIRYFIERREYDIMTINETLFCFDQPLLGS